MDSTKIINTNALSIPSEALDALAWNTKLTGSDYTPPLQGEVRQDGSLSAFISADSKSILFFDYCARNNVVGRIINDEVHIDAYGTFLLVQVKAYVYINDTLKGTAVAGQSVNLSTADPSNDLDLVIQYTAGLAKSKALTNAGFGVVASVTVPGINPGAGDPQPPANGELPFHTDNIPEPNSGNGIPSIASDSGAMTAPAAPVPAPQPIPDPNDPSVWARNVMWATKRKTMGELLNTSPKDIRWAAESMAMDCDVKRAAVILYPEACRILGVAPKNLR